MKFSMTLVFSILFLVVLVFYLNLTPAKHEIVGTETVEPAAPPMRILPLDENDEVTKVQVIREQGRDTLSLERQAGDWVITYPVQAVADPLLVEGLIASLRLSNQIRRLTPEKSWEEYGLVNPVIKIGIETKQNPKKRFLLFGAKTAIEDRVFAKWDGEKEYFLIEPQIQAAFSQSVYSLRMKRVFQMPLGQINKIQFRISNEEFQISKHQDKWFWMEPISLLGEMLESSVVSQIMEKIQNLSVKEFLDDKTPSKLETGFSMLNNSIKIWNAGGKEESVQTGNEVATKDAFYARKSNESAFLVSKSTVTAFLDDVYRAAMKAKEKDKTLTKAP